MATDDRVYAVWLSLLLGNRRNASSVLYSSFKNAREIFECDDLSFLTEAAPAVRALKNRDLSMAEKIVADCDKKGIGILSSDDSLFPKCLKKITNPPSLLYYRGKLADLNSECMTGIVGTRSMTDYGKNITYSLAKAFAESGAVVVSGLAYGIDAVAHRGAVDAGGYTVAVLGTPIDRIYPSENIDLAEKIEENGVIFSEYYPSSKTGAYCFPERNRLIAGLSASLIVTEAGENSGALITARQAIMQGKAVYAVPGSAGSLTSVGTNELLRNGARMVLRPNDVLSELELEYPTKIRPSDDVFCIGEAPEMPKGKPCRKAPPKPSAKHNAAEKPEKKPEKVVSARLDCLTDTEQRVFSAIDESAGSTADTIAAVTGLDISEVLSTLTMLEIYAAVKAMPGGKFMRN